MTEQDSNPSGDLESENAALDNPEYGDTVYQPQDDPGDQQGESFPDMEDSVGEAPTEDLLPGYSPPERERATDKFGTTGEEERRGESLDQRVAQELPDFGDQQPDSDGLGDSSDTDGELYDDQVGDRRAGRLVAPDEGAHTDTEKDVVAHDVGMDDGAQSAEEAAMHIIDEDSRG
jgi:hypothetical protein